MADTEKFIQTLKEQVLWIENFDITAELGAAVRVIASTYNELWLLEHYGYRSPIEARQLLFEKVALT